MEKLRACPFCQGECVGKTGNFLFIEHKKGCFLGWWTEIDERDAAKILKWNTRADPLLEEMERALAHLIANPEGADEWIQAAVVLQKYLERKA
jgi:hypothetical protein